MGAKEMNNNKVPIITGVNQESLAMDLYILLSEKYNAATIDGNKNNPSILIRDAIEAKKIENKIFFKTGN